MKSNKIKLMFAMILLLVSSVTVSGRAYHLMVNSSRVDHGGVNTPVQRSANKTKFIVDVVGNEISFPSSIIGAEIRLLDEYNNQVYSTHLTTSILELPENLNGLFILQVKLNYIDYYAEISL